MPLRVLIADDNPGALQLVRSLVEREGIEVVGEATDGQEAVHLAQAVSPDLAVLDLAMPRLSGLDAAREIIRTCPRTQVILLTIYAEEYQVAAALRARIRGYVVKSQGVEELLQAIREVSRGGTYLSPTLPRDVVELYLPRAGPPSTP